MREVNVRQVANVDDLVREKLGKKGVERDVCPAEVVRSSDFNRRSDVVETLRFFVKILQEGGVFEAKVRRWKVDVFEVWYHTERVFH